MYLYNIYRQIYIIGYSLMSIIFQRCINLSIYQFLFIILSTYLFICLIIYFTLFIFIFLSICLYICLYVYLSVYLSIYLSIIYLVVCLSVCLSVCLTISGLNVTWDQLFNMNYFSALSRRDVAGLPRAHHSSGTSGNQCTHNQTFSSTT